MARAYSLDLRERVVAAVGDGQSSRQVARLFRVSVASVVKWAQRSRATGSPAARPMGGRPGVSKLDGERTWLLARLAEKPDLTLHGLLAELRGRGVTVSCDTLWRFLRSAGISFKKNRVRQRAGSTCYRAPAGVVEEVQGADRSATAGLHRRYLGQDQHDPNLRLEPARPAAQRQSPSRAMDHHDLPGGPAARPYRRTLRVRRADQWPQLPCLRPTMPRPDTAARRRRRHGQPRQPQGTSRTRHPEISRRKALLPAAL